MHVRRRLRPIVCAESLEVRRLLAGTAALPTSDDVGSPGFPGSYTYANRAHSLDGSGGGIGGTGDQFRFAWADAVQDVSVSARVGDLAGNPAAARTGVMLRASATDPTSAMAAVVVSPAAEVRFVYRAASGAMAASVTATPPTTPSFLRLTRVGFVVSGSYSADGVEWFALGKPQRVAFDGGLSRAGIAVTSGGNGAYASATFKKLAIVGGGGDWAFGDVGPGDPGSARTDPTTDALAVAARGAGLGALDGGSGDAFSFVARPLGVVGSAVARVESLGAGVEAGVIVRADRDADAPFAAVLASSAGVRFVWRHARGAPAEAMVTIAAGAVSVRLLRDGDALQGYWSANGGATWTRVGPADGVAIALPSTTLAGVAASANASSGDATFTGVSVGARASPGAGVLTLADGAFLDDLGRRTANWFLSTQNATSGLFPDRAAVQAGGSVGGIASIASVGFGLSAIVIAASRGWAGDGYARALRTLTFLRDDADMRDPANHGYFYHFVNPTTGARSPGSELSPIDTALLMAGVLTAGQYWAGTPIESIARELYDRVDWTFMQPDGPGTKLRLAWSPEDGYTPGSWDSWSEGPLLYLLAMGSATHPISPASWYSFRRDASVTTYAGQRFYHASDAPLFTNQYPQGWFDLRDQLDRADADSGAGVVRLDPYHNARRHTLAQRHGAIDAAAGSDPRFDSYGPNAWGWTASDTVSGYRVLGGPPPTANVDGTIAPTAPGGSLAFTPRASLDALRDLRARYPSSYRTYGFVDAFNPRPSVNWYDADGIGIDQGMILVAAENLRGGLVWDAFMRDPAARRAVALAFEASPTLGPPSLASSSFAFESGQALSFAFAQDVAATLEPSDFVVTNLTTGDVVLPAAYTFARSGTGRPTTATVTFLSTLADGDYALRLRANAVSTADGTANVGELAADFFVLAGDANRDRRVDFGDLVILAQHYGRSGQTFASGNFDYDAGGNVGFGDLVILAQRYGRSLPPAASPLAALSPAASTPSRRSRTHVDSILA